MAVVRKNASGWYDVMFRVGMREVLIREDWSDITSYSDALMFAREYNRK